MLLRLAIVLALLAQSTNDAALIAKARAIHNRVIKIDTHNDIDPRYFTTDCNYTMRLTTQVNLPKMIEGGMDVSFMIVYVDQGPLTPEGYENAYKQAIAKFDAIHRLTERIAPDKIGLALTHADVVRLHNEGLRVAVIGVENGYTIGTDIRRVKEFYDRGARYMSLAHNGNTIVSRGGFVWCECAAGDHSNARHRPEVGGDHVRNDTLRLSIAGQIRGTSADDRKRFKASGPFLPGQKIQRRGGKSRNVERRVRLPDAHQPLRL